MSNKWIDKDGDAWDRTCHLCCNSHDKTGEYSGTFLYKCKVKSDSEFQQYKSRGTGNSCSDFRTDVWVS